MNKIIRSIKRLLGIYDTGYKYWINTKEIKVNPEWRKTRIGKVKFKKKLQYWYHTGEFESRIILDVCFYDLLMNIWNWVRNEISTKTLKNIARGFYNKAIKYT